MDNRRAIVIVKDVFSDKYRCRVCGYIYDPQKGDEKRAISPGISFEDLPDNWHCPVCKYPKREFRKIVK